MDDELKMGSDDEGRTVDIEVDIPSPSSDQSVRKIGNADSPSVGTSSLSVWSKRDKGWETPKFALEDSKDAMMDDEEGSLDASEVNLEDPEDPILYASISSFQNSGREYQVIEESVMMASLEDLIQPPNREPPLEMPTEPAPKETDRNSSSGSSEITPTRRSRKNRRSVALHAALRSSSRQVIEGSSGRAERPALPSSLTGINTPESPMTPSSGRRTTKMPAGLARLISKTNVLEPEAFDTQSHLSERTNASQGELVSTSRRSINVQGGEEPRTPPGRGYVHVDSSESRLLTEKNEPDNQEDLQTMLENSSLRPASLDEKLNSSKQSLNDSLTTFEALGVQGLSESRSPYRTPSRAERRILRLQERAERLIDSASGGLDAVERSPVPPGINVSASVCITPKGKREMGSPATTPGAVSIIQPMTVGGHLMAPDLSDSPKSSPRATELSPQNDKVPRSASDNITEAKRREQRTRELALIDEIRSSSTSIVPMLCSNAGRQGLAMSLPTIPSCDSNDTVHLNSHIAMLHSRPLEPSHPEDDDIHVEPAEERVQDAQVTVVEASPPSDIKPPVRSRWHSFAAVLLLVIVVVVAVVVAVSLSGGGGDGGNTGNKRVLSLLKSVSDLEKLRTKGSPQALAYTWVSSDNIAVSNDEALVDRYLLALFYYALEGTSWVSANGWLSSEVDICDWEFVSCGNGTEGVASIHAEANHLIGQIPSEIFQLQELSSIHLSGNGITGLELGVMDSNLVDLDLSNNVLEGSIPTALTVLSNLVKLKLEGNDLSGEIPSDFEHLTNISELSLAGSSVEGSVCDHIAALTQLEVLDISGTELSGNLDCLIEFENLVELNVNFLQEFDGTIPSWVGSLQHLKSFSALSTGVSGSLPSSLSALTSLVYLGLANTKVSGTFPKGSIGSMSSLGTLYLANTRISGTIPAEIGLLTSLVFLDLDGCSFITGTIPSELGSLTNLTTLQLGSTSLSGSIPEFVGELSSLESLSLRYSGLDGTVPPSICNLPNIATICTEGLEDNACSCGDDICSC